LTSYIISEKGNSNKCSVDDVLERLDKVRYSGKGWMACCPAHEDRRPSLKIDEGADGRVLLHCFAGCTFEEVLSALGLDSYQLPKPTKKQPKEKNHHKTIEKWQHEAFLRAARLKEIAEEAFRVYGLDIPDELLEIAQNKTLFTYWAETLAAGDLEEVMEIYRDDEARGWLK